MRVSPAILFCVCAVTLSAAPSPLADAAQGGDLSLVRSLLAKKTDVNAPQGDGMTALHWAAAHGDLTMTKALLAAKAPGDAAAFNGWLRQISQKTAEAASEGGGLFGGGVQVSDAEKATLGEISRALGI